MRTCFSHPGPCCTSVGDELSAPIKLGTPQGPIHISCSGNEHSHSRFLLGDFHTIPRLHIGHPTHCNVHLSSKKSSCSFLGNKLSTIQHAFGCKTGWFCHATIAAESHPILGAIKNNGTQLHVARLVAIWNRSGSRPRTSKMVINHVITKLGMTLWSHAGWRLKVEFHSHPY